MIDVFFGLITAVLGFVDLVLLVLTAASLIPRRSSPGSPRRQRRIAILIPAHDEEGVIEQTLSSLGEVTYPPAKFDVHVVADNCQDQTAAIVRNWPGPLRPTVLERFDLNHRGKGYAVAWGLERILRGSDYDAVMMLDADWIVAPNVLDVANLYLDRGAEIVQVWCRVADPTATYATSLRAISFALVNYVRPLGLDRLGLSCGLKGTGMVFDANLLRRHGWRSTSLIEDAEEHIRLILTGHRVVFAPEASIESNMPGSLRSSQSQNLRWESGKVSLAVEYVPTLIRVGLTKRSATAIAEAIGLTIPPIAVVVAAQIALLVGSLAIRSRSHLMASAALTLGLVAHVGIGMFSSRLNPRVLLAIPLAPFYLVWKLRVYAMAINSRGTGPWVRTPRHTEVGN